MSYPLLHLNLLTFYLKHIGCFQYHIVCQQFQFVRNW